MSQAQTLLSFGENMDLFVAPDGGCYATFADANGHKQTHAIRSQSFHSYLVSVFYRAEGKPPNSNAVKQAIDAYAAKARYGGATRDVYIRVAGHAGRVYIDLADNEWRVIEVDAAGWRVVTDAPVRFLRPTGMSNLPVPERGGTIDDLRHFVNVRDDDDFTLIVAFLLGSLCPQGPFAHLELVGEQGSAKSTTARVIRSLVDPNTSPLRAEPSGERDLVIVGSNSWMPTFDNLSHVPGWMSDALCRLSTGGGFSTRVLYTDADEKIFQLARPAIITAIGDVVVRGDLLDRTIVLRLPCLTGNRKAESELWAAFHSARARILGALLDGVSAALKNRDAMKIPRLPRLADFGKWVTAGEAAFGWRGGACLAAYFANQEESNAVALEGDPVAAYVLELAERGAWSGTATELHADLMARARAHGQSFGLPRSAGGLRNALNRLAPNLRRVGVSIRFAREGKAGTRVIHIQKSDQSVSHVSAVSRDVA